jgi:hypothetical protein
MANGKWKMGKVKWVMGYRKGLFENGKQVMDNGKGEIVKRESFARRWLVNLPNQGRGSKVELVGRVKFIKISFSLFLCYSANPFR